MGKHANIEPLPEPLRPKVFDLGVVTARPYFIGGQRISIARCLLCGRDNVDHVMGRDHVPQWIGPARPTGDAPVLHADHRGEGSRQPLRPSSINHLGEAWDGLTAREKRRLAGRHPELVTAIVTTLERNAS